MELGGQHHALSSLSLRKNPVTHFIEGLVDSRCGKEENLLPLMELEPQIIRSVA